MENVEHIAKEISDLVPVMIRHMYPFVFQPIELPPSQILTISTLFEKGTCRLNELSREMHNTAPTTSGIIDRLVSAGYVTRVPDPQDRRAVQITLTKKGVKIARQFHFNIMRRWEFILSKLPQGEGEEILKVLRRITRGFTDGTIS